MNEALELYSIEREQLLKSFKIDSKENRYNFADEAIKLSKTGLTSNRRIIQIKNGFLFYYKNIPKGWRTNSFELLKENPKMGIRLSEILVHYLGVDQANDSKYICMQINVRKCVLFKKESGKLGNIIENSKKGIHSIFYH